VSVIGVRAVAARGPEQPVSGRIFHGKPVATFPENAPALPIGGPVHKILRTVLDRRTRP